MIATISTVATLISLFGASPDIAQPVVVDPVELENNSNVTFVGFDGYFDCDAVKEVLNKNSEDCLQFVVVNNEVTQKGLLSAFLTKIKQLHHSTRVPFKKIQEHWANVFSAPVHIFVFCDRSHTKDEMKEVFGYSHLCFEMVAKSLELSRGFFWMGAMGIIEEQVKSLLNVPQDSWLVATIFFGDQKSQKEKEISAR